MELRKMIIGVILLMLLYGYPSLAEEEEISDEDTEVISVLDILDNLEILEEDLDLMEFLTEVGDEYEE